jgi:N-sulfoglucosamine sulfohydrolase
LVILLVAAGCAENATLRAGPDRTATGEARRPNIVFITADDMSYDSLGCTGCPLPDISPNLDRLAREGLLIDHCHVANTVCGPSRAAFITGTWPQRNGMMGHYAQPPKWFKASADITPISEILRSHGYYTGVMNKHPTAKGWDFDRNHLQTGLGRHPAKFEQLTREFLAEARAAGKPFFLHANSMDPHEYWAGQKEETKQWIDMMMGNKPYETYANGKPYPEPQITYAPQQIPVPPMWPDIPEIREDIYTYFNSVRRLDESVGAILRALEESGQAPNTMVVFISDHGIGREFAKWSVYPYGTRTPMIVRWPGIVRAGRHDRESVVSSIDLAPTFLEAAGVSVPKFMDARSILPIIRDASGSDREKRELVFASFDYMNNYAEQDAKYPQYTRDLANRWDNYRPMRAIHGARYSYIWNGWADGRNKMPLETSSGETIRRILRATGHSDRADFEAYRTREEFYDTAKDPGCMKNLIDDPAHARRIERFRAELRRTMQGTSDQELANFTADLPSAGNP